MRDKEVFYLIRHTVSCPLRPHFIFLSMDPNHIFPPFQSFGMLTHRSCFQFPPAWFNTINLHLRASFPNAPPYIMPMPATALLSVYFLKRSLEGVLVLSTTWIALRTFLESFFFVYQWYWVTVEPQSIIYRADVSWKSSFVSNTFLFALSVTCFRHGNTVSSLIFLLRIYWFSLLI